MSRRAGRVLVVLTGLLGVLLVAGPASAHVGGEVAGSDFDGRVLSVTPELSGVRVRVLQFGDELELSNTTAIEVAVPGYSGEPYLRIGPDGVWRNANSPATYLNLDRYGRASIPDRADSAAAPEWQQVSTQPHYVWHDHRTHWMSQGMLPPQVAASPDRAHVVAGWEIPLVHGDSVVLVAGELTWTPPPSPLLVWPGVVALLAAALAAGLVARTARPLGCLLLVGAAAALWHALTTPAPSVTLGSQTGAVVSALLPAVTTLLVAALGFRAARRGRGAMTGLLAAVLGWLLLIQGLPDVDVLWSANVLSAGPPLLARVAVIVLVSFGVGLIGGGIAAVRRFREPDAARSGDDAFAPVPVG